MSVAPLGERLRPKGETPPPRLKPLASRSGPTYAPNAVSAQRAVPVAVTSRLMAADAAMFLSLPPDTGAAGASRRLNTYPGAARPPGGDSRQLPAGDVAGQAVELQRAAEAADTAATQRLMRAAAKARWRIAGGATPALGGSLAPAAAAPSTLLRELTQFVETQLRVVERAFPDTAPAPAATAAVTAASPTAEERAAPPVPEVLDDPAKVRDRATTMAFIGAQAASVELPLPVGNPSSRLAASIGGAALRTVDIERRLVGHAVLTPAERRRRQRLDVFIAAQRLLGEALPSYGPFLGALADEQAAYSRFLEDDVVLHKEALLGLRADHEEKAAGLQRRLVAAEAERDTLRADATRAASRSLAAQSRLPLAGGGRAGGQAMQEQRAAGRRLAELEADFRAAVETNRQLRVDLDVATHQAEHLWLNTFSDALDAAYQSISQLRSLLQRKDDMLTRTADDADGLAQDLVALKAFYDEAAGGDVKVKLGDLRLSEHGNELLFADSDDATRRSAACRRLVADDERRETARLDSQVARMPGCSNGAGADPLTAKRVMMPPPTNPHSHAEVGLDKMTLEMSVREMARAADHQRAAALLDKTMSVGGPGTGLNPPAAPRQPGTHNPPKRHLADFLTQLPK